MKILWLCNIMLPCICQEFHIDGSKKEGWIWGLLNQILKEETKELEIVLAFPMERNLLLRGQNYRKGRVTLEGQKTLDYYGFFEDTKRPWEYEPSLEGTLKEILTDCKPDVLHCFGTEYPHTMAAVKAFGRKDRTLIGIQGLCSVYADAFFANLPDKVKKAITFRDIVKKDSLRLQHEKFVIRGEYEVQAIKGAGHIAGRTAWDKKYASLFHKEAEYHILRETLRTEFYEGSWKYENCEQHRIFVSQGDYPIKGLHYVLLALPTLLKKYPDTRVYVAGNCILRKGILAPFKISAYGRYLQKLLEEENLLDKVTFLGSLSAGEMKEQYLKAHVYLCPSSIENSPNSLGEAMLLGTPVVTADVGGIPTMISEENCFMYHGYEEEKEGELYRISKTIARMVEQAFSMEEQIVEKTDRAKEQGMKNHSGKDNLAQVKQLYQEMVNKEEKE